MDCLTELYQVKKLILMKENIDGNLVAIRELLTKFQSTHLAPSNEMELFEQICEARNIVRAMIPDEIYDEWEYADYEVYTDANHHRSFWNEIPNDCMTQYFFDIFAQLMEIDDPETATFCISLYDFNDGEVYFENQEDMGSFVNNYDCAPYTAFEVKGTEYIEMYSA